MLGKLINLLAKVTGLGKLWQMLNGYKAYLGGAAQMLAGASAILKGGSCWLEKLRAQDSLGAMVSLLKDAPSDPCSLMIMGGVAVFGSGLAAIGLRHSDEKLAEKL